MHGFVDAENNPLHGTGVDCRPTQNGVQSIE